MEAIRSRTRTVEHERAGTRPTAPAAKIGHGERRDWRWARAGACLIALAQQAVVFPTAALLTYRMLEEDTD